MECGDITDPADLPQDVLQFIAEHIDTVPHLEALLLLHKQPAEHWTVERVAARLYVSRDTSAGILRDLEQRKLVRKQVDRPVAEFVYDPEWDVSGQMMTAIALTYTRHLTAVATIIHRRAPRAVLEFARAFELKKD